MLKSFKGMFFYWDSMGIPLEMQVKLIKPDEGELTVLLATFVSDALKAGWKPDKIRGDLREAAAIGLALPELLKPVADPTYKPWLKL